MRTTSPTPIAERLIADHFAPNYAQARAKFMDAAQRVGATVRSYELPDHVGAQGEELATDVAYLGPEDAESLIILSSGVHGLEGLCGSGCQIAALTDSDLLGRLRTSSQGFLVIHGVNPYGFSHLRRTNEDNVDVNRNFIDFANPPQNEGYAEVHDLLVPEIWPPSPDNVVAISNYIEANGSTKFRHAATSGQGTHPDGLFYAGTGASWSQKTLREIIRRHTTNCKRIAWLDVHTGLGAYGQCEKINAGPVGSHENLALARGVWGADVFAPWEGNSVSTQARGNTITTAYSEVPQATTVGVGLEFGTRDPLALTPLRGASWLIRYGNKCSDAQKREIEQHMVDAFFVDNDEWKGMVWGQCRTALIQAQLAFAKFNTLAAGAQQ